jgi:predicted aspartyl protease
VGEVHVRIAITNPRAGATLSVIPGAILESLGITAVRSVTLVLADGRRASRDVGDVVVTVNDDSAPCRVVFGRAGDAALLGLTVLEQLGLAVDPVQRRLVSADFLLYTFS